MKKLFSLCSLVCGVVAAHAQTPITISQAQFPATAATVDRFQPAVNLGFTAPQLGGNRTWDYRSLTPQGGVLTSTYAAVVGTLPFAGSIRTIGYTTRVGSFNVAVTGYQGFDAVGLTQLGSALAAQSFPLTATGGANDALTIPAQNITESLLRVTMPLTSTTRVVRSSRSVYNSQLTVQALGLNQAPFRYVQRATYVDSVAGWGTLRVPVAGTSAGSAATPVLLVQRRLAVQDSFYLNNQPAPAALLSALGVAQGGFSRSYTQFFYRQNAPQYMLALFYPNANFATPTAATYSAEAGLPLKTAAARELAGGLAAWPNPVAKGQQLQFLLATVARAQPLHLTLRDALGRVVASTVSPNGEPASLPVLPAGLYLMEAEAVGGEHASLRVVIE